MRRDQFTMTVQSPDGRPPTLDIVYDGPESELHERLRAEERSLTADDLDAAFRQLAPSGAEGDDTDSTDETTNADPEEGVFSLTYRLTGAYLLEANVEVAAIRDVVTGARNVDDDARYRVRIRTDEDDPTVYEMSALFVYDSEGELLRQRSLIPSGVEL
jgi:hypothetical protein